MWVNADFFIFAFQHGTLLEPGMDIKYKRHSRFSGPAIAALSFFAAAFGSASAAQNASRPDHSLWNDGNYAIFRSMVLEHLDGIKQHLGRIPLTYDEMAAYFLAHPEKPVRERFFKAYGTVQMSTNCYAFAVGDPHGHKAGAHPSPGLASGFLLSSVRDATGDEVAYYAQKDGLIKAANPYERRPGMYRVALVIDPHNDFHWYRENEDGTWSHKNGHMPVSHRDASGKIILDPQTADRDYSAQGLNNYSHFFGYFFVPNGGIDLNTPQSRSPVFAGLELQK